MSRFEHLSILIIEDNPGDQLLLQQDLLSTNLLIADVVMVETLAQSVNYIHQQHWSLIFLDLFLPDSTGLDSLSELIKVNPKIPIVVYSGLSDAQVAIKAITFGAQDFLIKGDYTISLLEKTVKYSIERKHNLESLEDSNTKFNLISKATHDMIWDRDLLTGVVERNAEGWRKIFKTPKGREPEYKSDWLLKIHPDDRNRVKQTMDDAIDSDTDQLFELECRILRDDNTIGYVEDRGHIVRNDKGKSVRVIGATQDITQRKNAEAELKKLSMVAEETLSSVFITDANRKIQWVNNAFTKITEFTLEEAAGKSPSELLYGTSPDEENFIYLRAQTAKGLRFESERLNYTKSGKPIWVWLQLQAMYNDAGELTQYFGVQTDITRQKELEEKVELEKILKQKQITDAVFVAQENERTEIGRELHDNVNQLLGATRLYIDMAKKNQTDQESLLTNASTHTLTAIEEIRKLSKILITPLIKEIGLADTIKDLAAEIMNVHPVQILFTEDNFIEAGLSDKFKLNIFRIVQEQINNILKHAQAKNIYINIKDDDKKLFVSITDDGIGFDTTKRKSGVGLTNIKSRSELYNGDVLLSSVLGKGTTLSITFNNSDLLKEDNNNSILKTII